MESILKKISRRENLLKERKEKRSEMKKILRKKEAEIDEVIDEKINLPRGSEMPENMRHFAVCWI